MIKRCKNYDYDDLEHLKINGDSLVNDRDVLISHLSKLRGTKDAKNQVLEEFDRMIVIEEVERGLRYFDADLDARKTRITNGIKSRVGMR